MNRLTSILASVTLAVLLASLPVAQAFQIDTNATTTATQYTPQLPGEVLIGKTGSTDTVWIAKGGTSNDWVGYTISLGGLSSLSLAGATLGTAAIGTATISTNCDVANALTASSFTTATMRVSGIATFQATQTVWSAAAAAAPTNVQANGVGLRVRINGTNYFIPALPN